MNTKGMMIAAAVASAMLIGGCAKNEQSMPSNTSASQTGESSKLGKLGTSSNQMTKTNSCKANSCKANSCKANS